LGEGSPRRKQVDPRELKPVATLSRWSPAFILDSCEIPAWLRGDRDFEALGMRIPKGLLYFDVVEHEGVEYGILSPIAKNLNWVLSDQDPSTSVFRASVARIAKSIASDRIRDLAKVVMKPGVYDPDIPQVDSRFPTIMAPVLRACQGVLIRHPIYGAAPVEVLPTDEDAIIVKNPALLKRLGGDLDGDLYGVLPAVDGLLCDFPVPEVPSSAEEAQEQPAGRQGILDEELAVLHSRLLSRQVGQPTLAAYQAWSGLAGKDLRYSIEAWNKVVREIFDQKHNGPAAAARPRPKAGAGSTFYRYLYDRTSSVQLKDALAEFLEMLSSEVESEEAKDA